MWLCSYHWRILVSYWQSMSISNFLTLVIHYNHTVLRLAGKATFDFEQQRKSPSSATYKTYNSGFCKYQTHYKPPKLNINLNTDGDTWGFHSTGAEDSIFLGCDASLYHWFVIFLSNVGTLFSRSKWTFQLSSETVSYPRKESSKFFCNIDYIL